MFSKAGERKLPQMLVNHVSCSMLKTIKCVFVFSQVFFYTSLELYVQE